MAGVKQKQNYTATTSCFVPHDFPVRSVLVSVTQLWIRGAVSAGGAPDRPHASLCLDHSWALLFHSKWRRRGLPSRTVGIFNFNIGAQVPTLQRLSLGVTKHMIYAPTNVFTKLCCFVWCFMQNIFLRRDESKRLVPPSVTDHPTN